LFIIVQLLFVVKRYIDIPREQKTGRPKNKISGKLVRTGIFVVRPAELTFVPGGAC
jgi:hypothetical protein